MRRPIVWVRAICAALVTLLIGCGGGGGGGGSATGSLAFVLKWPARSARVIPNGAKVVVVKLTLKNVIVSKDVPRPDTVQEVTVLFPGLTPGMYVLTADSYSDLNLRDIPHHLSTATTTVNIPAGGVTRQTVVMDSTVKSVKVTAPSMCAVAPFQVAAAAYGENDSNGQPVMLLGPTFTWQPAQPSNVASVNSITGLVTPGQVPGIATITAKEDASNVIGSATVYIDPLETVTVPDKSAGIASLTGTVHLKYAAGPGGLSFELSSSDATHAAVPATVKVLEGFDHQDFTITTTPVSSRTTITITARCDAASKSGTLTLYPLLKIAAVRVLHVSATGETIMASMPPMASPLDVITKISFPPTHIEVEFTGATVDPTTVISDDGVKNPDATFTVVSIPDVVRTQGAMVASGKPNTVRWAVDPKFAPLFFKYFIGLGVSSTGASIRSTDGFALDGELTPGSSTSGDNIVGGDFHFTLDIHP